MENETGKHEELIVSYLSGNLTAEEYDKLNSWLENDNDNVTCLNEYNKVWMTSLVASNPKGFDEKEAFRKFKKRVSDSLEEQDDDNSPETTRFKINHTFLKIAAIILVSFGLGIFVNHIYFNKKTAAWATFQEIAAPLGSKTQVLLPDQSIVMLNAGSKIKYYSDFGVKNREVWLEGEGYFTVAKNKEKSFIVRAGSLIIKALGTQFNVMAYPSEGVIETSLIEGKVKIEQIQTDTRNVKRIVELGFLNPNERLIYKDGNVEKVTDKTEEANTPYDALRKDNNPTAKNISNIKFETNVDLGPNISWRGKRWIIKGEELADLAVKLVRKYDVKIIFEDEQVKNLHFTGILQDESIDQVIKAVSLSSPVLFRIEGKNVYLRYNNQFITTDSHDNNK